MSNIKLTFTGDAFLTKRIIDIYKKGLDDSKYDLNNIFVSLKPLFEQSDLVISNLETPLSENKDEWGKNLYLLTAPKEFATALFNNGIRFVTTANNHCLDNGLDGIDKTIDILDSINIGHTGTYKTKNNDCLLNINGIKISILSYTYGTNAFNNNVYLKSKEKQKINMFQNQELSNSILRFFYNSTFILAKVIRKILSKLKLFQFNKMPYERTEFSYTYKKKLKREIKNAKLNNADLIIMCMHEGGQYNKEVTSRAIKRANFLFKNGVDIIIGNHEHVIHKVEKKKEKFVAYSLGNLTSTFGIIDDPKNYLNDYSILIHIYIEKNEKSVKIEKITFTILKQIIQKTEYGEVVKTEMLNNLINKSKNEIEKKQLLNDNKNIIQIVLDKNIDTIQLQDEYIIS